MIYLDHAATTPVPEEVAHAVYDTLVSGWGNPSSQYPIGKQARDAVAAARETIAAALGCKSEQFVFTSCGSESDNWAVRLALHQNRHAGKHIITTAVEHSAILETCKALEQEGYSVTYLKPDKNGDITASQVESALRDDTALVTMMLVNNETGLHLPRGRGRAASESEKVPCPAAHRRGAGLFENSVPRRHAGRGPHLRQRAQARRAQGYRRPVFGRAHPRAKPR